MARICNVTLRLAHSRLQRDERSWEPWNESVEELGAAPGKGADSL